MTATTFTDARTAACPDWCVEHYTGEDGTQNHSGPFSRGVVGESARDGSPMEMFVWPEVRVTAEGYVAPVGVIGETHREADDIELTAEQLRRWAAHLIAVAQMCERVAAERNATTDASQLERSLLGGVTK